MAKASKKKLKTIDLTSTSSHSQSIKGETSPTYNKRHLVLLLLIAVAAVIAYSNTFNSPFVFDDNINIADNPVIKNLDDFLSSTKGYDFSPNRFIGYFTFALNYKFGGVNTTGYHIVNLAVHIINSFLVFFLALLTFKTPLMQGSSGSYPRPPIQSSPVMIALFSALIFAVHPIQTQAVTYIVQRFASLAALFYLTAMVMYIKGRLASEEPEGKTRAVFFFVASILAAVLAMKTKEMAFTLPLSIVLYEFTFFKSTIKKKVLYLSPILLTLIIIPISIVGTDKPLGELLADLSDQTRIQTHMGRWEYFVTQISVITTYIRLLFLPIDQNLDYDYPIYHSFFEPTVFLSFLFLVSILGAAAYLLYRSNKTAQLPGPGPYYRLIAFGVFWFFITLSVESSIIPIVDVIFEHRVYLPSVGLIIAFTALMVLIAGKNKKALYGVLSLTVVILCSVAYARNLVWKSGVMLFEDVVEKSPNKARSYHNLGVVYLNSGQNDKAIEAFNRAVVLNPQYAVAFYNLGVSYANMGRIDRSIEEYNKAIALRPNFGEAYSLLGIAYTKIGQTDKAIDAFSKAISANPNLIVAYHNLGLAYANKGELDKALAEINKALALNLNYARAYNVRGRIYILKGDKARADQDFRQSCGLGNKEGCELLQNMNR